MSIFYGFANYNLFQLYQNKEISPFKVMKHACLNILHYSVLVVRNIYDVVCLMYVINLCIQKQILNNSFIIFLPFFYFLTFIFNVIIISIVLFTDEQSKNFCRFFVEKIFVEVTCEVNCLINPINLIYKHKSEKVTNERILQLQRTPAITLFCLSMSMILVGVITFFFFSDIQSDALDMERDKFERYYIFFKYCIGLMTLGTIVGFAEVCSLNMRKFIAHHAYILEDETQNSLENCDRYKTQISTVL